MKIFRFNFYLKLKLMEQGLESAGRMMLNQCFLCACEQTMLNKVAKCLCTVRQRGVKVEKGTCLMNIYFFLTNNSYLWPYLAGF